MNVFRPAQYAKTPGRFYMKIIYLSFIWYTTNSGITIKIMAMPFHIQSRMSLSFVLDY